MSENDPTADNQFGVALLTLTSVLSVEFASGAPDVVSVFAVTRRPPASSATSVNVPPMSRPSRIVLGAVTLGNPHCYATLVHLPQR